MLTMIASCSLNCRTVMAVAPWMFPLPQPMKTGIMYSRRYLYSGRILRQTAIHISTDPEDLQQGCHALVIQTEEIVL